MPQELYELLNTLRECAAWTGDRHHPAVRYWCDQLRQQNSGTEEETEQFLVAGLDEHDAIENIFQAASLHGGEHPVTAAALEALLRFGERAQQRGQHALRRGQQVHEQTAWEKQRLAGDRSLSAIRPGQSDHRLHHLDPATAWTLVTGNRRAPEGLHGPVPAGVASVAPPMNPYVGLLIPGDATPLLLEAQSLALPLPEDLDTALQSLLDKPVGILGLLADDSPTGGLCEIVQWTLRLLPAVEPCALSIVAVDLDEQEGVHWPKVLGELYLQWAAQDQQRASRIRLAGIQHFPGQIGERSAEWQGGANLLRLLLHTWEDSSRTGRERLQKSGLTACLHRSNARSLRATWDQVMAKRYPDGEGWSQLINEPVGQVPGTIPASLLEMLACAARNERNLWDRYRRHTQQHLDSKAIRFETVTREIDWLVQSQPAESDELPARLRLSWLTAQVAAGNLRGDIEAGKDALVRGLCDELFEEDAPLVCQAELRLAVRETNRFAFDDATRVLGRWSQWPVAVPGRQLWARLQSSLGQHAAFRGELGQAELLFDTALEAFDQLSDEQVAQAEWKQTATYRAIVVMDDPDRGPEQVRAALRGLVDLEERAIRALAASDDPGQQYQHHLLTRYLIYRGNQAERRAYVGARRYWRSRAGHPWELIQAYRALLLDWKGDRSGASDLIHQAWALAFDPRLGPTAQLIGAVFGIIGIHWGTPWPEAARALDQLEKQLPLARPRLEILREALRGTAKSALDPAELIRRVLPFNFH